MTADKYAAAYECVFYIFAAMFKKCFCYFLAALFLAGGMILPLGDFSMLRDIPDMYKNYTKITTQEEMGVVDFIGDYLLHGKEIFGNNEHDKAPAGNGIQFHHQASQLNVTFLRLTITLFIAPEPLQEHAIFHQPFRTSGYQNELFRPPLALS